MFNTPATGPSFIYNSVFRMFNMPATGPGFVVVDTAKDNVKLLFTGTGNLNA
jgi:hypothetical protein